MSEEHFKVIDKDCARCVHNKTWRSIVVLSAEKRIVPKPDKDLKKHFLEVGLSLLIPKMRSTISSHFLIGIVTKWDIFRF